MTRYYLNKHIKRRAEFGGELPPMSSSSTLANIEREEAITPLSNDTDPRVKKLKKALEGLSINLPKQKYIKIF